ncbi:PAS domain-containing protein [Sulfurimonas marina]|uniref:PAS domain-containing protein n=1 Tax=Sulfurimonas marina TaxID=2590551 RepID=A0A7M1AUN5_9BACT|nr:PAS domain-containing protein [Sulfurimonas marina]QOP41129.1 PAS domain-containing protein [Sulfurimonas marina]
MSRPTPKNNEISFGENEIIVSKTDPKGIITYGNEIFIRMSGYQEEELLGKPHNILRHPDMPRAIFKLLWNTIQDKEELNAYVKNLCKDGSYYWVLANVTPSYDKNDKIIGYFSVRRKPSKSAIEFISKLYTEMLQIEKSNGVEASYKYLTDLLEKKGMNYEEFILSI